MKKKFLSALCAAAMTISANATTFFDVRPTDWYYDAVHYVCENGIMNGTSTTQFSPYPATTRGMLVTILYRWAGSPAMPESNWGYPYADVDINAYYGTPVYWARMNNIVTGYSDERFAPDNAIPREQLAAILYRYAGGLGLNMDTDFMPDKYYNFSDYAAVSRYAAKAMSWCVNKGIINGSGEKLYPQGVVSRAEVAQVLMNADRVLNSEQP